MMRFPMSKAILVGGVLVSIFTSAIFVSCHSMTITNADSVGNFLVLPIAQSLSEPCCMTQGGNYDLHSLPLAIITSTTTSQNSIPGVASSPIWIHAAVMEGLPLKQELYLGSTAEVPLYNYLTIFVAQGLLQPLIYSAAQTSV